MEIETAALKSARDRRTDERFELSSLPGHLHCRGNATPCEIVDISLGGCCLRSSEPFDEGALAEVEVSLSIFALNLRIRGITQWATHDHLIGVRFNHPSPQSRNQLASLLTCLIDTSAAPIVREAVASGDFCPSFKLTLAEGSQPSTHNTAQALPSTPPAAKAKAAGVAPPPLVHTVPSTVTLEEDGVPGVLCVPNPAAEINGSVLDLCAERCRFRTAAPRPLPLNEHVELHVRLGGVPLHLHAVIDEIHDPHTASLSFAMQADAKPNN